MRANKIEIDGTEYLVVTDPARYELQTRPYLEDCGHAVVDKGEVELKAGDSFLTDDHLSDLVAPRND